MIKVNNITKHKILIFNFKIKLYKIKDIDLKVIWNIQKIIVQEHQAN